MFVLCIQVFQCHVSLKMVGIWVFHKVGIISLIAYKPYFGCTIHVPDNFRESLQIVIILCRDYFVYGNVEVRNLLIFIVLFIVFVSEFLRNKSTAPICMFGLHIFMKTSPRGIMVIISSDGTTCFSNKFW